MYKSAVIGLGQIGYKMDEDPFRKLIWSHSKAYIKSGPRAARSRLATIPSLISPEPLFDPRRGLL